MGRGGRAVQSAEVSGGSSARRQAAFLDAVCIFRRAVPGRSATGGLASAELAVLPPGDHAARHRMAVGAPCSAGRDRRIFVGARFAAHSCGCRVYRNLLRLLRTFRGDQLSHRSLSSDCVAARVVVGGTPRCAVSAMAAGAGGVLGLPGADGTLSDGVVFVLGAGDSPGGGFCDRQGSVGCGARRRWESRRRRLPRYRR